MKPSVVVVLLASCSSDPQPPDPTEEITTITLTFTPSGGGAALVFESEDLDGEGGNLPVSDPLNLPRGMWDLSIGFENRLADPPAIITDEIIREATNHQVLIVGGGVDGPAVDSASNAVVHAYADEDPNGNPLGLENTIDARGGAGAFLVVLRHMPPTIDGVVQKTADVAEQVRTGGVASLGGENDINLTFTLRVN